MPAANNYLILFTAEFPYGNKGETFLETEIKYLANSFNSVTIVPSSKSSYRRALPRNVAVDDRLTTNNPDKSKKLAILLKNTLLVCRMLISEITDKGTYVVINNFKEYLDFIAQQLVKSAKIKSIPNLRCERVTIYDYWFQNSTLALSILKQRQIIPDFISRGHGYDIYDERNKHTGIKFRFWIIKRIMAVYVISEYGASYFRSKIAKKFHSKIIVSKLGVEKPKQIFSYEKKDKALIVSCSRILSFKHVERIPLILAELNTQIHWVHFGGGPAKNQVEANCHNLPNNITFELKGNVNNADVLKFYQENNIDLFISLSTSEGLPVSMMEAQSHGVPIVAFSISGIPEIVKEGKTGLLLNQEETNTEIALKLEKALKSKFHRKNIRDFHDEYFNATKNYEKFTRSLIQREKNN